MKLIIGLGNPGKRYQNTRHNIGFLVVDKIVEKLMFGNREVSKWQNQKKFKGKYLKVGSDLLLVKPQTYMNLSGHCVSLFVNFYKVDAGNLWVVHDDIDLPLGKIKIKLFGGTGGHKGVESIVKELGSNNFVRFRLGIGRGESDAEQFVLSPFLPEEEERKEQLINDATKALKLALEKGLETAMNRFN